MNELEKKYNQYYNYAPSLTPKFPKVMLLETTNHCNHNCIFCSHSKMSRAKGFMKEELAYRLLREAYRGGVREVGFYLLGEPLLDHNLEKYISYAKKLGYSYTFLTTNGFLLDEQRMVSIINAGLDSIKFSFNAGSREHYIFVHGVDCYEKVKDNIIRLSNYRKEKNYNFKIYMSSMLTKYTQNDDKLIKNMFSSYVDHIVIDNCISQDGKNDEIDDMLVIEGSKNIPSRKKSCFYPFNRLHITYEGYLNLCCIDFQNFLVIEDLNDMSLEDAWTSEKFQQIRQKHIDGNLEKTLCYNCINDTCSIVEPISEAFAAPYNHNSGKRKEMIQTRIDRLLNLDTGEN